MGATSASACAGKQAFESAAAAAKAMRHLASRRNSKPHVGLSVYHCRFCSQWHLGTSSPVRKQQLRKLRERLERKHPDMHF